MKMKSHGLLQKTILRLFQKTIQRWNQISSRWNQKTILIMSIDQAEEVIKDQKIGIKMEDLAGLIIMNLIKQENYKEMTIIEIIMMTINKMLMDTKESMVTVANL